MEDRQPVPSLLGLGPAWTRVGYVVLALAVAALIMRFVAQPFLPFQPGQPIPAHYQLLKGGNAYLKTSADGIASVFLLVFSALATFVWTLADVFDRRKRFVWLMPMFVCPFIMGLHALPLALYIFYGRETSEPAESVK